MLAHVHPEMPRVAVINAGGWGTALAIVLARTGLPVRLYCRRQEMAEQVQRTRENLAYLPGVQLPPAVLATASVAEAVDGADAVIMVPISRAIRETARSLAGTISPGTPVMHAAKGLQPETFEPLSAAIAEELGPHWHGRIAALSGPTHAEEVARNQPTAAVVACADPTVASTFQRLLHGPTFRVYTSPDIVGVELCGALKNVVALATGASDGLGYGDNARAAMITRALAEIGRLVARAGGDPRTVTGLAGLGDLVATCTSQHSRNRWAGEQLARGSTLSAVLASTPKVIEGVPAARAAVQLAARLGVSVPVCTEVAGVLFGGKSVREALGNLMAREATAEI